MCHLNIAEGLPFPLGQNCPEKGIARPLNGKRCSQGKWRLWRPVASWETVTSSPDKAQCRIASELGYTVCYTHTDVVSEDLEQ